MEGARFRVGKVPLDPVTLPGAIERIVERASSKSGGTVYTPNVDHVVVAEKDPAFRAAYSEVGLSLIDGMPVFWAGRLLGFAPPEKVSGSDLFEPLVARAAQVGLPIFLLGGGPGVAELARDELVRRYPGLRVVGILAPRIDASGRADDEPALIAALQAAEPALVFVACGAPKSELFSHRIQSSLGAAVFVCVGAAIDFTAGTARRAPRWLSRVGLEWAYRLFREPRRLAGRYLLRDPQFFWILGKQLFALWGRALVASLPPASRRLKAAPVPLLEESPWSRVRRVPSLDAAFAPPVSAVLDSGVRDVPNESGVLGVESTTRQE